MSTSVRPFLVSIGEDQLNDLCVRLRMVRWSDELDRVGWDYGIPVEYMQSVRDYWLSSYDWCRAERALNTLPQFHTDIDGLEIHFVHYRSSRLDAMPLVMTHGWPGSILEFLKVVQPLAEPDRFGAPGAPAFHVVCPSLPGYGFSGKPRERGWDIGRTARAWSVLMSRLGYESYVAQGGDIGSLVATTLGQTDPNCAGVALNLVMVQPPADQSDATEAERAALASLQEYAQLGSGYVAIQSTRPQTLAFGLSDSPIGQAAWMLEKFHEWSDRSALPGNHFPLDDALDNVMIYWLTGSNASAARMYREIMPITNFDPVPVPTSCSIYPQELFRASRRWADARYGNIVHWVEHRTGGHFAAMEQPEDFVADLREFVEVAFSP